jgi:hypothetical protein
MAVSGSWTLHYSWGCTGSYGQLNVTFNANGTFSGGLAGKWVQQDGTLLLGFDGGPAKYGGTLNGNVGSGAMSTFTGTNGCWYLTKAGTAGIAAEEAQEQQQEFDAAGSQTY